MATVTVKSNAGEVFQNIAVNIAGLNPEAILRPLMTSLIVVLKQRIHTEGKASDGGQIGTYSSAYLKLRQKKYKRTADKKIIVSLTRQLEGDWSVIATPKGYGIGFKNIVNFEKAINVENIKGVKIFDLTADELELSNAYITKKVGDILSGKHD